VTPRSPSRRGAGGGGVSAVIPARYGSTRLPGKPLLEAAGKPIIQYVWERASAAESIREVVIATDDERILEAARAFGARAEMTRGECASGTDRVAELAGRGIVESEIIVNVQGDEPEIESSAIDAAARLLLEDESADIGTLVTPLRSLAEYENPNAVKAVVGRDSFALYFSRSPVPYVRGGLGEGDLPAAGLYRHVGLYSYRREALLRLSEAPPSRLESLEKLEQLRALELALRIKVAEVEKAARGIDTREDFEAFARRAEESRPKGG